MQFLGIPSWLSRVARVNALSNVVASTAAVRAWRLRDHRILQYASQPPLHLRRCGSCGVRAGGERAADAGVPPSQCPHRVVPLPLACQVLLQPAEAAARDAAVERLAGVDLEELVVVGTHLQRAHTQRVQLQRECQYDSSGAPRTLQDRRPSCLVRSGSDRGVVGAQDGVVCMCMSMYAAA